MLRFGKNAGPGRWFAFSAAALALGIAGAAHAAGTISSNNSTLSWNPTSSSLPLFSSWTVDGTNQYGGTPAGGEQFYFAVGNAAPAPISSLTFTPGGSIPGEFTGTFTGSGFTITVKDTLTGGSTGSGNSTFSEVYTINSTNSDTFTFHFYEYTDFNVNATPTNDTLALTLPNTANQSDPLGANMNVDATPSPNEYQIANDSSILTALTGSNPVTLNNNSTGPITGNDNFAFQWDQTMTPTGDDSTLQVSINETLTGGAVTAVPLPPAIWSALIGLAGLGTIGFIRSIRKARIA